MHRLPGPAARVGARTCAARSATSRPRAAARRCAASRMRSPPRWPPASNVYIHCRAGIGRTGLVAGCFLVEQGRDGDRALERTQRAVDRAMRARRHLAGDPADARAGRLHPRVGAAPGAVGPRAPRRGAGAGRDAGRRGAARAARVQRPRTGAGARSARAVSGRDAGARGRRCAGRGDAVSAPGSFAAVGDMLGGGPFDLPRGAWSDDTAMALCLAESLVARGSFDARDQLERYTRWQREGTARPPASAWGSPRPRRARWRRPSGAIRRRRQRAIRRRSKPKRYRAWRRSCCTTLPRPNRRWPPPRMRRA